jgi:serine/threonine protein kinase
MSFDQVQVPRSALTLMASGGNSMVYEVLDHKVNGQDIVIKCSKDVEAMRHEYRTMLRLRHLPTIVAPLGYAEHSNWAALSMAHGGNTLLDALPLLKDSAEVRSIVLQVQTAVAQLHNMGVAHLDIKPDNFVVNYLGIVRVIDLGFAVHVPCHLRDTHKQVFFCGTRSYCAPEILSKTSASPFMADLWSLGVTLFAVATRALPFCEASGKDVRFDMFERKCSKLPPMACIRTVYRRTYDTIGTDTELEKIIDNLLLIDPNRRTHIILQQIA